MKLEILFVVAGLVGLEAVCLPLSGELKCQGYEVKKGEPLKIDLPHDKLFLDRPKGSMDSVTFKELQSVEKLTLYGGEIESMDDGTLCSLKNLQSLKLEFTQKLPKLTHKSMGNCDKLEEFRVINLMHTHPEFLNGFDNDVFQSMKNVKAIHLNTFVFRKFDKAILRGLKKIQNFTIAYGDLGEIDDDAFCAPKLKRLQLKINTDIFSGRLFKTCNNVESLAINSNLKNVFKDDTLQSMTKLTEIYLQVNLVTVNEKLFANLFDLKSINLGKCHIIYIDDDAFADQKQLKELTINDNLITNLNYMNYLKPLKNLEKLNLVFNKLTDIDYVKSQSLRFLYVSNNEIDDLNATVVIKNLPKLERLEINNNLIHDTKLTCKRAQEINKEFKGRIELITDFNLIKPCP